MLRRQKLDLISVVLPIYNVEPYLKKCLDSVIAQTYKNIEIILVDDGSLDNSGVICDNYATLDNRIVVIHKANGGLSDARNTGIKVAKGKYLTFIDSDDYIETNYIEVLYNSTKKHNADISIGGHNIVYQSGKIKAKVNDKQCVLSPKHVLEKLLYDNGVDLSSWAKLYDKNLFNNIKFPVGRFYEDSATTYKLVDMCKVISVEPVPVYNYCLRNTSITKSKFTQKKLDLIISTKEMCEYIKNKYPDLSIACNRRLMWAYLSTLSQLALSKDPDKKIKNELWAYIKQNRKIVLKDKKLPKRDRLALYLTYLGFGIYKLVWRCYYKLFNK